MPSLNILDREPLHCLPLEGYHLQYGGRGGATSLFPYDERMGTYLKATGREGSGGNGFASVAADLRADDGKLAQPKSGKNITTASLKKEDLSLLEPYINGPFTPDAATPISKFAEVVITNNYPRRMEVGLIGSCTNSSYRDLSRAALPCPAGKGKEFEGCFLADCQPRLGADTCHC